MSTAVATRNGNGHSPDALMEAVLVKGDLSKLSPKERSDYYLAVCRSTGLNPLTKPMEYITLNGRLTLYALRNCTDQLRSIHKISVIDMTETERDGVCIVTCKVSNSEGRTDIAKGAVNLASLKGEALANAIMKAETKAKRRATLSICGLSLLDETEIEDIPAARKNPHVTNPEDIADVPSSDSEDWFPAAGDGIKPLPKKDARPIGDALQKEMYAMDNIAGLRAWKKAAEKRAQVLPDDWREILSGRYKEHRESLLAKPQHVLEQRKGYVLSSMAPVVEEPPQDPDKLLSWIDGILTAVIDPGMLEPTWSHRVEPYLIHLLPPDQEEAMGLYRKHERRLS